jgi:hypothetical protein
MSIPDGAFFGACPTVFWGSVLFNPLKLGIPHAVEYPLALPDVQKLEKTSIDLLIADLGAELAVLAAIAYHQPVTRDGLKQIFGREISRELIGRLAARDLIAPGPRAPQRGAPHTFVTTEGFLTAFDLSTLADLPELEGLQDAGLVQDHPSGLTDHA